jgi:beta-lactamase regulating signal transducer with metallopeptidase domain
MIEAILNHLWQSTLFMAVAGLLTLMLRRNGAHIRFWLWFAASVKFLIPFAAVSALVGHWPVPIAPEVSTAGLFLMQPAAQPFSTPSLFFSAPAAPGLDLTTLLLGLWGAGFAVIAGRWLFRWRRLRGVLRRAIDLPLAAPVAVKMAPSSLEPGLVGIWRPVILLPQGLTEYLSSTEIDSIMAHEICHVCRRDNLMAATHMLVEALFWFYPPVWWLGARLNAERERACDERVLESGRAPQVYAESILKVCKLYLNSPLACAAGVSGADLKKRLERIMEGGLVLRLSSAKKLALGMAAFIAIATPLMLGLAGSASVFAQTSPQAIQSPEAIAEMRAEQAIPRKAVPFEPANFDRYVGYYQLGPTFIMTVSRDGGHFLARLTGQTAVEWFPESGTKFFATEVPAQISFNTDAAGRVTELVLHQNGYEQHAPRVSKAAAQGVEAALARRIKNNTPSPGTEAALRNQIESMEAGRRDYSTLMPALAAAASEQWAVMQQKISSLGALKSITFKAVSEQGWDIYAVSFERGQVEWQITPLTAEGKISGMFWRRVP